MEPFKNKFSPGLVRCMAGHLEKHVASFDRAQFEASILNELSNLELKARAQLIADHIHAALPTRHTQRARILKAMLHPNDDQSDASQGDDSQNDSRQSDDRGIRGWGMMPLTAVVGQHGLNSFEGSLNLLREMTPLFSSEFDVRYFLMADQTRALKVMRDWVHDPNHHVRRLVSEGTRPRLPWGIQLTKLVEDPAPLLPLLRKLRKDPEEYVRRSVANSLNDIAKDHPDLVADLAFKWMRNADETQKRLLRHACRTLIKQGHSRALEAFGYAAPKIRLKKLAIGTKTVALGESLTFSVEMTSTGKQPQDLIVDYVVHFRKANGKLAGKVFKWKMVSINPGETLKLTRYHPIKPITTRTYYRGQQSLSLRVNGKDFGRAGFKLI